jgi:glycosyltransferase involved in cell wall biosynthesis
VVLFVGRFVERKGIFDILKAARVLPEYEFWLVGGSKTTGSIKIAFPPNVRTVGFVEPYSQIVRYYAQATLCVFPSHWENFPIVGLEAMACGKPVVATELGFSEYVENGRDGILIKPHDFNGLVNSIRYLMEDYRARRKIGENARKKALQYDWSIITGQYETMYEGL